jgi:hypothetical protein
MCSAYVLPLLVYFIRTYFYYSYTVSDGWVLNCFISKPAKDPNAAAATEVK